MIPDIDAPRAQLRFMQKCTDRWCYFGGGSSSTTHQTESNKVNPYQMQQYQDNYTHAQTVADSLKPYTGQVTAGFNQNQLNAQGLLSGIAADPRYAAANQQAIDATQGLLAANPNTTVNSDPYTAAQLAGTDLTPYMNPFQKSVIDASLSQNQYARDQQGVADNAAATAAHAFGGTRQGVQRAETTAGYDRNNQQNIAALNSANFLQAQNAAGVDVGARNAASQFNSGQAFNAQQLSIQNALAQAGYKLNAAGQLVVLNQADLQRGVQQAGILSAVGDTQQQQQQKEFGDAFNLYAANNQLTLQQQQLLNQALGIIPLEQTNTTDGTTTTKSNPGIGGVLGGIASLGGAIATGGASLGLTGALGGLGGLFGGSKGGTPSVRGNAEYY